MLTATWFRTLLPFGKEIAAGDEILPIPVYILAIICWTGDGRFAFRQDDKPMQFSQVLEADGHLIDSDLMTVIFDKVIERGGTYEILDFRIGRTNEEFSHLTMKAGAPTDAALSLLVEDLLMLGCHPVTGLRQGPLGRKLPG